jgi:hypothetical protein
VGLTMKLVTALQRFLGYPTAEDVEAAKELVGPSPYPWLSDRRWADWNWTHLDVDPDDEELRPIHERTLTVVSAADRERAPVGAVPADAELPPVRTLDGHEKLLDSTHGGGFINLVRWPVCCRRLGTLLSNGELNDIEAEVGPLDNSLIEAAIEDYLPPDRESAFRCWAVELAQVRGGRSGGDGMALFQCRSCGRIYGSSCEA